MNIRNIDIRPLVIPFKTAFKHSSASRDMTETVWVTLQSDDGLTGLGESCPRSYVTGETIDSATGYLSAIQDRLYEEIHSLDDLMQWVVREQDQIDRNPAAWCAMELALLDLLARSEAEPVEKLLGLPDLENTFVYSAVLGDSEDKKYFAQLEQYIQLGFTDFKVKVSGNLERDRERLARFETVKDSRIQVRIDANNLWSDPSQVIEYMQSLNYPIWAIEEPLEAGNFLGLNEIIRKLDTRIILDESFLSMNDFTQLSESGTWIINLRVSKMGGLLRSLEIIDQAKCGGIGLILGSQVGETSLLTRAALALATYIGGDLLAQEGAFGTYLLSRDHCTPSLMFGQLGVLDIADKAFTHKPGWGLSVNIE